MTRKTFAVLGQAGYRMKYKSFAGQMGQQHRSIVPI